MAVVTRIALHHLYSGLTHPEITKLYTCFQLFPSEVSRRFDEVTVHIGDVTGGLSFILWTKSFFGISYRQLSMPKDLIVSKNKCL